MAVSALSKVGVKTEATWGAGGSPDVVFPVDDWTVTPAYEQILDNAKRGQIARDYAAYQGIQRAEASMEGPVFPYYIGYILRSIFGSISSSGGGSGTVTHTFTFHGTPPSLCVVDDTVLRQHEGKGMMASEFSLSFSPTEGMLRFNSSWVGNEIGTANTYTFPSVTCPVRPLFRGWQGSVSLGGSWFKITEGEFTIARDITLHYQLQNTQAPGTAYAGAPEVTGSFTIDYGSVGDYNRYLDHEQGSVNIKYTIDGANDLEFQFGSVDFSDSPVELDKSGASMTLGYSWRGLYDCNLGGPAKAILISPKDSY